MNFKSFYLIIWLTVEVVSDCNLHTTILRELHGEGFHLDLASHAELVITGDRCPDWSKCTLALEETLSSSFYVDHHYLLASRNKSCTSEVINTESPQHKSHDFKIYQYSAVKPTSNLIEASFYLPIRLRYHSPAADGVFEATQIPKPQLLLHCLQDFSKLVRAPCPPCLQRNCSWNLLPFKTNFENFTVYVPIGDLNHLPFVTALTYFLTFGGCFYLLVSLAQTH